MLNHLLVICLLGPKDGLAGVNKLMPRIIEKWRGNVKTARRITSMFRDSAEPHWLPAEFGEQLHDFTEISTDDFMKEVLSVLNDT